VREGHAAVFFDRDGTLIEDVGYLKTATGLRMIDGAPEAVRRLNSRGFLTFIISNQSGVARGFFTEEELAPIHERLEAELETAGAHLDRIYYCPHHPTRGAPPYNVECTCRKPRTGMLDRAVAEFGVDLSRSFVVGDKFADVKAGQNAGTRTVLVLTGYGPSAVQECRTAGITPDAVRPSIAEAVTFILEQTEGDAHHHA
jgi:D-glycero-D-manno-heptose 1,7-bisphosphate phosphatase